MAYTEKVSLSGTALAFLLYECVNSVNSQEGFLIGDITSEFTNHISDSQSDNARQDVNIVIKTVLPLPSVSLFYSPTGRIKEDVLSELLSGTASEVVGWYKYRKNTVIKPTFRDKLISKGLQKYFEKHHGKETFVTCNLSNRISSAASTHSFIYRFGKVNCFDLYVYIEDVIANLGEKLTAYRKPYKLSPNCIFNKIVRQSDVQSNNTNDAILRIQQVVDERLLEEAKVAGKNEHTIRELEAEIKLMNTILSEKQTVELQEAHNIMMEQKLKQRQLEIANACMEALKGTAQISALSVPNITVNTNHLDESKTPVKVSNRVINRSPSPILTSKASVKPTTLNYAAALKNNYESPSTSKANNFNEDLITFDIEEKPAQKTVVNNKPFVKEDDVNCLEESSPEY